MGTVSYTAYGYGMTEGEALRDALDKDRYENGHQEGYSGTIGSSTSRNSKCVVQPKPAKTCTVEKEMQKGTRKWVTVFRIEPRYPSNSFEEHKTIDTTQGDAIKEAKKMAIKFNKEFVIAIDKKLVGGTTHIANVKPKKSTMGKWKFWGDARE